jgi:hypothetical protein
MLLTCPSLPFQYLQPPLWISSRNYRSRSSSPPCSRPEKKPAPVRLLIPARRQGLSILLSMSSPPAAVHRAMAAQPSSLFSAPSPLQELGQPSSLLIAGGLLTADADSSSLDARPWSPCLSSSPPPRWSAPSPALPALASLHGRQAPPMVEHVPTFRRWTPDCAARPQPRWCYFPGICPRPKP